MKHTLITLITGIACALPVTAQDKPDAPREGERREAAAKDAAAREGADRELAAAKEKIAGRMKAAMEEAAELEKAGKHDAAEAKRKEAEQQRDAAIHELQQHMRERRQAEVRREGEPKREGEARRESEGRRPDGPPRQELENKLRHVEQAIGHLREAGMPEPAEQLNQIANRLRGALRGEGDGPRREEGRREEGPRDQPRGDIEALRREIQELRQAVQELSANQERKRRVQEPTR